MKITFETFKNLLIKPMPQNCCQEILFDVENSEKYHHCWMGAINKNGNIEFWFGLTQDRKEAYDYTSFEEMISSPVFMGKTLKEVWENIDILSVNSCEPQVFIK